MTAEHEPPPAFSRQRLVQYFFFGAFLLLLWQTLRLLSPFTVALLLAFINIYRREYQWLLNPPRK